MDKSSEWKDISFSVDLVISALNQLYFLKEVNDLSTITKGDLLRKAIYRYEKVWLPLLESLSKESFSLDQLFPPIDVAWVWHCHLLSPTGYSQECHKYFGQVFDHQNLPKNEMLKIQTMTKEIWEKRSGLSFDQNASNSVGSDFESFKSNFKYDLHEASLRQKEFYYQTSLPHFKSTKYLEKALERYKKFIFIKKMSPSTFVVPCFAIDLIWHTHQLNPKAYEIDTKQILGYLFPHDDSVNDRTPGAKLENGLNETQSLWKKTYNEYFFFPGGMYRGDAPTSPSYSCEHFDLSIYYLKCGTLELNHVELVSEDPLIDSKYTIQIRNKKHVFFNKLMQMGENNMVQSKKFHFIESKMCQLMIETSVIRDESIINRFLGLFSTSNQSIKSSNYYFNNSINIRDKSSDFQTIELKLKNNEKLVIKCQIDLLPELVLSFDIVGGEFEKAHMSKIKDEMKNFSFKTYDFNGVNGDALRANHKVKTFCDGTQFLYNVEILHMMYFRWSSIRILDGNKNTKASSRLIGLEHLPSNYLVSYNDGMSLDPTFEKAMLVSNFEGDFSIIKGKWVGFEIPESDNPGNRGSLHISLFSIAKNSTQNFVVPKNLILEMNIDEIAARINFKTGEVEFRFNEKQNLASLPIVESTIATILSISVLHVLLQPKILMLSQPKIESNVNLRKVDTSEFSNNLLLNIVGFDLLYSSLASNCYGSNFYPWIFPTVDTSTGPTHGIIDYNNTNGIKTAHETTLV